ncbi:DUF1294 domain-containing protein [Xanthomonas vesicatoria]|uniref:DUF1294 domain-containing protein n=1 Tax=Xanthomonas vesicatoria TaxID=56460 RepID=UPI001E35F8D6|nr:DUF1294 domain-containing protein [Xanthomonas vesicatoria]MCC8626291.1 DUF1294 domain-containing protein [Xanthomonas vesicatoria]
MPRKTLAALFAVSMASIVAAGLLQVSVALWYAVASSVALIAYRRDKSAATRGQRRTPEATLHGMALLGGWPGALLAQSLFRHKYSKTSFQVAFWATSIANSAVLAWAVYRSM